MFVTERDCLKAHGYTVNVSDLEPASYPAFLRGQLRDPVVRSSVYGFFDTATSASTVMCGRQAFLTTLRSVSRPAWQMTIFTHASELVQLPPVPPIARAYPRADLS